MRQLVFLFLALLSLSQLGQWAWALRGLELAGRTYVSLAEVAELMGAIVSESVTGSSASLTLRGEAGVLVVFDGSPDVLWQPSASAQPVSPSDLSLTAPVVRREGVWYAPEELFALFDMRVGGEYFVLPSGRRLALEFPPPTPLANEGARWERVALGNGVHGLALFSPGEGSSLLLVDAGLLSLAFPEAQPQVDAFMAGLEHGRPLYFVVTALAEMSWDMALEFSQAGRSFIASHPVSLSILAGEASKVSPGAPVSGVILLPDWLNPREPVTVRWEGVEAVFRFRR